MREYCELASKIAPNRTQNHPLIGIFPPQTPAKLNSELENRGVGMNLESHQMNTVVLRPQFVDAVAKYNIGQNLDCPAPANQEMRADKVLSDDISGVWDVLIEIVSRENLNLSPPQFH